MYVPPVSSVQTYRTPPVVSKSNWLTYPVVAVVGAEFWITTVGTFPASPTTGIPATVETAPLPFAPLYTEKSNVLPLLNVMRYVSFVPAAWFPEIREIPEMEVAFVTVNVVVVPSVNVTVYVSTKPLVDVFVIDAMFDPFVTVNVCVDPFDSVTVYVSTTPDVDVLTMLVMPVPVLPC